MSELADCVRTACLWEARARKAGNVHPFAEFEDLEYSDFVRSGDAIAPVLDRLRAAPLGITVLEAIRATRAVISTNTNLGIVLLLTPLSKIDPPGDFRSGVRALLDQSTVADAAHVYEAIRLAAPGGMGKVEAQDIAHKPTQTLREVMSLAADRDLIARQYANGFSEILDEGVPALLEGWERYGNVEAAILTAQIHLLARFPDSLIARKRGVDEALRVRESAQAIERAGGMASGEGRRLYREFDRRLRADGNAHNPGTTADLITACLFIALREHRMNEEMPFEFREFSQ